ncbi:RING-type E3 ubiquitin transferase [Heracleum sosnowskyi]|uniref:RING-type E3 ubiquitin transferase n=1 Tax=Heracleum sosnowskyi TaxID=360622 RepID=A0AAD8JAL0_9APIA|nr:RING-type E3 ubiquitin transferase [Heracleum sosnowskyi]
MLKWGGVGFCVESLRSVGRINQLKDLSQLLDTASKVLPLIVSVSGKVGSDRPIKCETSGLECVILKETTEKHILKRVRVCSKLVPFWKEELNEIKSVIKEVPWYLDDGTGQVFVVAAQRASYWKSTVGRGRCYRPKSLPITGTLDDFWKDMDLVVKTTEPVLLAATPLTVIGEAIKDETGTTRVRQPEAGPFYVSRMNIDELTANVKGWAL